MEEDPIELALNLIAVHGLSYGTLDLTVVHGIRSNGTVDLTKSVHEIRFCRTLDLTAVHGIGFCGTLDLTEVHEKEPMEAYCITWNRILWNPRPNCSTWNSILWNLRPNCST